MVKAQKHFAILGSVGVPARYGGFETLAEQLARHHARTSRQDRLSIYCSSPAFEAHPRTFKSADLAYLPFNANGAASVPYDILSLMQARANGVDVALVLGVSGAIALPFLTRGKMRIVAHVDGQEWRRTKWSPAARCFLRICEALAVRHADAVIADSPAIAEDLWQRYGRRAEMLTYGGDQAADAPNTDLPGGLPHKYALSVCRIEPENNIEMILRACMDQRFPLVCVGNWEDSAFGRKLRARYGDHPSLHLLDPIYEAGPLQSLRRHASLYLHGHSAGGTNPSLVEMMHVGCPVLAFDCIFNRQTTFGAARYFRDAEGLSHLLAQPPSATDGARLQSHARDSYKWADIGARYFDLLERVARAPRRSQKSKISSRKDPRRFFFLPRS